MADKVLVWSWVIMAVVTDMSVVVFLYADMVDRARGMLIPATCVTLMGGFLLWALEVYGLFKREREADLERQANGRNS